MTPRDPPIQDEGRCSSEIHGVERQRRLAEAMEQYLSDLEDGLFPDPLDYATRHPELADSLHDCLKSLEFVHRVAPRLVDPSSSDATPSSGSEIATKSIGRLGDFRLLRQIGRGGMGVVYEAEQVSLRRRVALKVLPFAAVLDKRQLKRFMNEAQAAASLEHPNIVNVFFVGEERGVHFYAMRLIDGVSLTQVIEELKCPLAASDMSTVGQAADTRIGVLSQATTADRRRYHRTVAEWGVQVAEALDYAHQTGIVHRDVKPSNLLLDADGNLWVTDFGLAETHGDASLTATGELVGTLRYMSPEQASGRRGLVDQRSDVYGLGATLFELLTLRPLIDGANRLEILRRIDEQVPPAPRTLDASIPRDLETIVLKATARRPDDRYLTCAEFADDLKRFLEQRLILARRSGRLQRLRRWALRNRTLTAMGTALVLCLLAVSIGGPLAALNYARLARQSEDARRQADAQRIQADASRRELQDMLKRTVTGTANVVGNTPQMQDLHRQLLEESTSYYDRLVARAGDDVKLRLEAAEAYQSLARLHYRRREFAQSEELCGKCIGVLKPLLSTWPQDRVALGWMASTRNLLGHNWFDRADPRGIGELEASVGLAKQAVHADPESSVDLETLVHCQIVYGYCLQGCARASEALTQLIDAEERARQLAERSDATVQHRGYWPYVLGHLSVSQECAHQFDESERSARRAMELYAQIPKSEDVAIHWRIAEGACSVKLGHTLFCMRRSEDAASILRTAISVLEVPSRDFPTFFWARESLVDACMLLAFVAVERNEMAEAEAAIETADKHRTEINTARTASPDRDDISRIWYMFDRGFVLWWLGRHEEARGLFQSTKEVLEQKLAAGDPLDSWLLFCRLLVTCPETELRDTSLAAELAQSRMDKGYGNHWQLLGLAQYRAGRYAEARESLQRAAELHFGGDAIDGFCLSMACAQVGDRKAAGAWYRRATERFDRAVGLEVLSHPIQLRELQTEAESMMRAIYHSE